MTVLLVGEDASVSETLGEHLETRGMTVTVAATATAARQALQRDSFLVVVLEITIGDGSGLDLLEELRRMGSTAHVIMTSSGSSESDRVRALEHGADDFVIKPFHIPELAARVLAFKRRDSPRNDLFLRAGHLEINIAARAVVASGELVELTAKEFDLLAFLAARPGYVFSRDELLRAVWHSAPEWQQAATVTEHIHRLRAKVERDSEHPQLLRTVRGAGYRFDRPAEACDADPVEASPPGVGPGSVVWTADRIVSADSRAVELLGCGSEQDIIGRSAFDFIAPRSVDAAVERLRLAGLGGTLRSQLLHLLKADGTEVAVELDSWASEWEGQPARSVTFSLAPEPSVRLRHLVTGIATEVSDAVVVTDLHFHIRSWNRAAERLYGWAEHEVLGRHVLDVLPWAPGDVGLAEAGATLETTGRWHGEAQQITREGAVIRVQGSTTVARDDEGEPIAVVSVNRAVTLLEEGPQAPTTHDDLDMRRGIDAGEFEVYYQPLVALDVDRIVAVEGLIRWNHPSEGLLAAGGFIETAERNGLIVELGSFVLDSACHQGAAWLRTGHEIDVGINLSARELADPSFIDRFAATLESSGMDPHHLWIEVTESMLVEDVEQAKALLHRLVALGVRISIDDFGTGWASLTYLKQFPIHALKIDRSFVESIDHDLHDTAIARSILSLGRELGIQVVAEGVETEAQQQALVALGCSMVQGFLYGVPTRASAVPLHRLTSGGSRLGGLPARPMKSTDSAVASTLEALQRVRAGDQRDQAGDERDQAADHRDESADDRDNAADLRDEAGDHRDQAGDQRDNASVRRDEAAARRDRAADQRDAAAGRRDEAGAQRDEAGDRRDRAGNRRDEVGAGRDDAAADRDQAAAGRDLAAARLEGGADEHSIAAAQRHSALARQEAEADRRKSAEDRQAGASERVQAESDRDTAQADRGVGADERAQAEADRENAHADRGAGASERTQAEADRDTSQADRDAGASERTQAEADRDTSQTDRDAGASERTQAEADRATAGTDRWSSARERGEGQLGSDR